LNQSAGPIVQTRYDSPHNSSDGFEMDWDVRLEMDRGSFNAGILAENVFGSVSLIGRYDGKSTQCNGSIAIDSMHWKEMQITDIRGPIWIEDERVGVGSMARPDHEATTPVSLTGNLFGGTIRLDGQCWNELEKQFFVQASVSNLDVKKAGQQGAPSLNKVGGTASLAFRVGGGETTESMRGEGVFQLREANIYELPVVLRMLKMMKTQKRDRSAFDASNADFTIQGNSINIAKVELLGDAISLVGKGRMTMDNEVDLDFYTVAGRNRFHIPILSDLAKASSQQILWLRVDGTVENPQVRSEILPGLNESVRQLFQTAEQPPPRLRHAQNQDTRWR
ncbi:AsmA-like C-terminal region-containing protein, partial [bacterium]|nr:AsmA-like C-terminal region-containing protein [bacterium]